jgi:hypothetical protein
MKKIFLTNAAAILLVAAFGMLSACSGHFVDPGWAAEANSLAGSGGISLDDNNNIGGGSENDDDDDTDAGSENNGKPDRLSSGASYNEAIAKLNEIIAYCGNTYSLAPVKSGAQALRDTITTYGSSGWSSASGTYIYSINKLIDSLP